jgi:hypothetical protein
MNNLNSGYHGMSRSVRSHEAIQEFEMPLSLINRQAVDNYIKKSRTLFTEAEIEMLREAPVSVWRYVAKTTTPTSWHHTGSKFAETNHYSLDLVADAIIDRGLASIRRWMRDDKESKERIKQREMEGMKFGIVTTNIWEGRKHPRITGTETSAGVIVGTWLYTRPYFKENGTRSKIDVSGRNVKKLEVFDSYTDLTKAHPNFKGTKKTFNDIMKGIKK